MRLFILLTLCGLSYLSQARDLDSLYKEAMKTVSTDGYEVGAENFETLRDIARIEGSDFYRVKSCLILGYLYDETEKFASAVNRYLEGAAIAENSGNSEVKKDQLSIYKNLSIIMGDYEHYELAHKYIDLSLKIAVSLNYQDDIVKLKENKAHEYNNEKKYSEALSIIEDLFDNYELMKESAISINNKAGIAARGLNDDELAKKHFEFILENAPTDNKYYAFALHNIGEIVNSKGSHSEAIDLFEKSIRYKTENQEYSSLINSYKELANVQIELGKLNLALTALHEAEKIDIEKYTSNPENNEIYSLLSNVNHRLGNDSEAFYYSSLYSKLLEKYIQEQDVIDEEDKRHQIELLTNNFYANLEASQRVKSAERLAQFGIGGTSSLVILIILFFLFRQKQLKSSVERELKKIEETSIV